MSCFFLWIDVIVLFVRLAWSLNYNMFICLYAGMMSRLLQLDLKTFWLVIEYNMKTFHICFFTKNLEAHDFVFLAVRSPRFTHLASSVPRSAVHSEGEGDLKFLASSFSTMLNNLLNNDMFFLKKKQGLNCAVCVCVLILCWDFILMRNCKDFFSQNTVFLILVFSLISLYNSFQFLSIFFYILIISFYYIYFS